MEQTDIVDQWLTNEVFVQVLDEIKEIRKNPVDEAVFQAYFVEDMSVKEIAAKCGLTESAVKSIVYRMRRRAKKKKATLLTFLFALAMGLNQLFL